MKELDKICAEILDFLHRRNNFLITTHLSADGDAYGAALAMAYCLESLGKTYQVVLHDSEKAEKYRFLWGWEQMLCYKEPWPRRYEAAVVVDVPSQNRIGDPAKLLPDPACCLKIDHHPVEEDFSRYNLVDEEASSTCQLVYEIVARSKIAFQRDLATLLLSGIMYDTGRFSFSNTNRRDFEIAAHLVSYGVKPHQIANRLFFSNNFESMQIIGYGLANMESHLDGKVCVIYLPREVMESADKLDIEELANYSLAIKGVEVGLFIRQTAEDLVKVSFRSQGRVDVNRVARNFGGGGHLHAAGCRTSGDPLELKRGIIEEIKRQL